MKRRVASHEQLEFTYWSGGRRNWYIPYIDHGRLAGMEFTGKVVSIEAEKMKIGLQIDEPYVGADHDWEWTPVSGSIMYAMPEKGNTARLYFCSSIASEGTAAGVFVSSETIMTATMLTGYTVTFSNMAVKVNDSMVGLAGRNMMSDAMGQENYQQVKDISAMGSNAVLMLGLSNPRLYGTNNNVGNIRENASYKNNNTTVDVNGKTVTMDNNTFDPNFVDKQGRTNVQRM